MQTINGILALFYKEYKLTFRNFDTVITIIVFFLLGIFIFVFSVGPNKETLKEIGVGIIWTLLLLSTNLSINRFYQEDFDDGSIFLLHIYYRNIVVFIL